MKILGIDPSLTATGYGVIETVDDDLRVVSHGVIKPPTRIGLHLRLGEIARRVRELIEGFEPDEIAVENPFYARNIKTAITLGQVRGAVLVAVSECRRDLFEYSALEIKQAVTGYGQADKDQVQHMVKTLLDMGGEKMENDASDALAAAICHANARRFQSRIQQE
jgi:crossover junction endodeoxyribonuclease RuvC